MTPPECPICDRGLGIDDAGHISRCLDARIAVAVSARDAEWSQAIGFNGPPLDPELAKAHLAQVFQTLLRQQSQ